VLAAFAPSHLIGETDMSAPRTTRRSFGVPSLPLLLLPLLAGFLLIGFRTPIAPREDAYVIDEIPIGIKLLDLRNSLPKRYGGMIETRDYYVASAESRDESYDDYPYPPQIEDAAQRAPLLFGLMQRSVTENEPLLLFCRLSTEHPVMVDRKPVLVAVRILFQGQTYHLHP
jgi:hypothetical protein